jgi:hypothetical protein
VRFGVALRTPTPASPAASLAGVMHEGGMAVRDKPARLRRPIEDDTHQGERTLTARPGNGRGRAANERGRAAMRPAQRRPRRAVCRTAWTPLPRRWSGRAMVRAPRGPPRVTRVVSDRPVRAASTRRTSGRRTVPPKSATRRRTPTRVGPAGDDHERVGERHIPTRRSAPARRVRIRRRSCRLYDRFEAWRTLPSGVSDVGAHLCTKRHRTIG